MKNNYKKFPVAIRIISLILVVTFLAQDIAWAHPDNYVNLAVTGLKNPEVLSRLRAFLIIKLIEERSASLKGGLSSLKLDDILKWERSTKREFEGVKFEPIRDGGVLKEVRLCLKKEGLTIRYYNSSQNGPIEREILKTGLPTPVKYSLDGYKHKPSVSDAPVRQSAVGEAEVAASPVPAEEIKPPAWAKGLRIYYAFGRNSARPGKDRSAFGNFTDLKYVVKHARDLGFNAVFTLPLCDPSVEADIKADSPYSLLSSYGLDPRNIDWEATGLKGTSLYEKWQYFTRDASAIPQGYMSYISDGRFSRYANVKALRIARDGTQGYPLSGLFVDAGIVTDEEIESTNEFTITRSIILMEQFYTRQQLLELIKYAHELDMKIGVDKPFLETMEGVDAKYNRKIFLQDGEGKIEPAGNNVDNPDPNLRQFWGSKETQKGLARYDWDELKKQDYEPIVAPIRYFVEELGFDFVRGDAFHYGYGQEGLYEKVSEVCRKNDALFIPETLGCWNETIVNGACQKLGMMPINNLIFRGWGGEPSLAKKWEWVSRYFTERSRLPEIWMPTHHDSLRIMYEYDRLFSRETLLETRARVMHLIYGLALPNYSALYGDEFFEEEPIQHPGHASDWKHLSPFHNELANTLIAGLNKMYPEFFPKPRHDLTGLLSNINKIRDDCPYLGENGNIHFISASDREIVFVRYSPDGKKALISMINPNHMTMEGKADLKLHQLGVDLNKGLTVKDMLNKDMLNDEELKFNKENGTLFPDGSVYYKLAPGACHVFEVDINKERAIAARHRDSLRTFFFNDHGMPGIHAGYPHFGDQEWGRDTHITMMGVLSDNNLIEEARDILIKWAAMEDNGSLPNVSGWGGGGKNYNTSDAPLWFINAVYEYTRKAGIDEYILDEKVNDQGKTVRDALKNIMRKYSRSKDQVTDWNEARGVHMDQNTGFIWTPIKSTWMDTENTERQGYACEIQALWYNANRVMAELDQENASAYNETNQKLRSNFLKFFWNPHENTVYDILGTNGPQTPWDVDPDPAVTCNQIFVAYFGLVDGESAEMKAILESTKTRLLLPGSLRSQAAPTKIYEGLQRRSDGVMEWKTARVPGENESPGWPHRKHYDHYEGDPSYHRGVAWGWPNPFYWVTAVREGFETKDDALRTLRSDSLHLMQSGDTGGSFLYDGSLPELTNPYTNTLKDGEGNEYQYAYPVMAMCNKQAWSVGCSMWAIRRIGGEEGFERSKFPLSVEKKKWHLLRSLARPAAPVPVFVRDDPTNFVIRINQIRQTHPYLEESGNIQFISNTNQELIFARHSQDGKKALVCIFNPTYETREGKADLKLHQLGVNLHRGTGFAFYDLFNKKHLVIDRKNGNLLYDGSFFYKLPPGGCHIFEVEVDMERAVMSRFHDAMRDGDQSERSAMISHLAYMNRAYQISNMNDVLKKWAVKLSTAAATADAPLWLVELVSQYIELNGGNRSILDEKVSDEAGTLRDCLRKIIDNYHRTNFDAGIHTNPDIGFIWVPKDMTWMGPERQGYPVEIQALMYNADLVMARLDPEHAAEYGAHAEKIERYFLEYFWNPNENTVYDVLGTDGVKPPWQAIPDPAVRPNQIFTAYFGLVKGDLAKDILRSTSTRLLVPGALRSLAEPQFIYDELEWPENQLPRWKVRAPQDSNDKQPAWPWSATYYSEYQGDQSLYNGIGYGWLNPFYWVTLTKLEPDRREEARTAIINDSLHLLRDPEIGGSFLFGGRLPEATLPKVEELKDSRGDRYLYARPIKYLYADRSWSAATTIWGLDKLSSTRSSSSGAAIELNKPGTMLYPLTLSNGNLDKLGVILSKGIRPLSDPGLTDAEKETLYPRSERSYLRPILNAKVKLSIVGRAGYKATTAAAHCGSYGGISLVIDPDYVRQHPEDFEVTGTIFNSEKRIRFEDIENPDAPHTVYGLRYKHIKKAGADETLALGIPPEAIIRIIVHSNKQAEQARYRYEKYSDIELAKSINAYVEKTFAGKSIFIVNEEGTLYESAKGKQRVSASGAADKDEKIEAKPAQKLPKTFIDTALAISGISAAIFGMLTGAILFIMHFEGNSAQDIILSITDAIGGIPCVVIPGAIGGALFGAVIGGVVSLVLYAFIILPLNAIRRISRIGASDKPSGLSEEVKPPSILEAAEINIRKAAQTMEMDPKLLEQILEPKRVTPVKFEVLMDSGEIETFHAFRALQNDALGPGKGGLRWLVGRGETLEEAQKTAVGLATLMSVKNAVIGIPYGGGKGDVFVKPIKYSLNEKARMFRGFSRELTKKHAIGTFIDVPAPDMGTGGQMMGWFLDEHIKTLAEMGEIHDKTIEMQIKKVIQSANPKRTSYLNRYVKLLEADKAGILQGFELGMVTGKLAGEKYGMIGKGGSQGRTKATGFGGFLVLDFMLKRFKNMPDIKEDFIGKDLNDTVRQTLKKDYNQMTAAVQGTGNVGEYHAWELYRKGVKITLLEDAVDEEDGFNTYTLYNPNGINLDLLNDEGLERLGDGRWANLKTLTQEFLNKTGCQLLRNNKSIFWETHTNIKVPAATQKTITAENVGIINCEIIVELANYPTTPAADEYLKKRGILVIPDVLANVGGVTVSYYEWLQNIEGKYWRESTVDKMLEERINIESQMVLGYSRKFGVGLREAAFILYLSRVANATIARSDELAEEFRAKKPYKYYGELGLFPATIEELNRLVKDGEFGKMQERADAAKSNEIDGVVDRVNEKFTSGETSFVLISGPTTSGKLGLAVDLVDRFNAQGKRAIRLNFDKLTPNDLRKLKDGEEIEAKDDIGGKEVVRRIVPQKDDIFVVEGNYTLSDEVMKIIPRENRFGIFVNTAPSMKLADNWPLTSLDLRLLRHILTVHHTEGRKAIDVIRQWPAERKEQIDHVYPTWVNADMTFNGYLPYELPIIKFYAQGMIDEALNTARREKDEASIKIIERLRRTLKDVTAVDPKDFKPQSSSVLQYMGGDGFYGRLVQDDNHVPNGNRASSSGASEKPATLAQPGLRELLVEHGWKIRGQEAIGRNAIILDNISHRTKHFRSAKEGYAFNDGTLSFNAERSALLICDKDSADIKEILTRNCISCIAVSLSGRLPDDRRIFYLGHFLNDEDGPKRDLKKAKTSDRIEKTLKEILKVMESLGLDNENIEAVVAGGSSFCGKVYAKRAIAFLRNKNIKFDAQHIGGKREWRDVSIDLNTAKVSVNATFPSGNLQAIVHPLRASSSGASEESTIAVESESAVNGVNSAIPQGDTLQSRPPAAAPKPPQVPRASSSGTSRETAPERKMREPKEGLSLDERVSSLKEEITSSLRLIFMSLDAPGLAGTWSDEQESHTIECRIDVMLDPLCQLPSASPIKGANVFYGDQELQHTEVLLNPSDIVTRDGVLSKIEQALNHARINGEAKIYGRTVRWNKVDWYVLKRRALTDGSLSRKFTKLAGLLKEKEQEEALSTLMPPRASSSGADETATANIAERPKKHKHNMIFKVKEGDVLVSDSGIEIKIADIDDGVSCVLFRTSWSGGNEDVVRKLVPRRLEGIGYGLSAAIITIKNGNRARIVVRAAPSVTFKNSRTLPRASSSGANEKPAAEPAAPAAAVEGGKIEPSPLSFMSGRNYTPPKSYDRQALKPTSSLEDMVDDILLQEETVRRARQLNLFNKTPRILGLIGIIITATAFTLYTGNPMYMLAAFGMAAQFRKKYSSPKKLRKGGMPSLPAGDSIVDPDALDPAMHGEGNEDLMSIAERYAVTKEERTTVDWEAELLHALKMIFIEEKSEKFNENINGDILHKKICEYIGRIDQVVLWARLGSLLGDVCHIEAIEVGEKNTYYILVSEKAFYRRIGLLPKAAKLLSELGDMPGKEIKIRRKKTQEEIISERGSQAERERGYVNMVALVAMSLPEEALDICRQLWIVRMTEGEVSVKNGIAREDVSRIRKIADRELSRYKKEINRVLKGKWTNDELIACIESEDSGRLTGVNLRSFPKSTPETVSAGDAIEKKAAKVKGEGKDKKEPDEAMKKPHPWRHKAEFANPKKPNISPGGPVIMLAIFWIPLLKRVMQRMLGRQVEPILAAPAKMKDRKPAMKYGKPVATAHPFYFKVRDGDCLVSNTGLRVEIRGIKRGKRLVAIEVSQPGIGKSKIYNLRPRERANIGYGMYVRVDVMRKHYTGIKIKAPFGVRFTRAQAQLRENGDGPESIIPESAEGAAETEKIFHSFEQRQALRFGHGSGGVSERDIIMTIKETLKAYPYLADNPRALLQALRFRHPNLLDAVQEDERLDYVEGLIKMLRPEDKKLRLLPEEEELAIDRIVAGNRHIAPFRPYLREFVRHYKEISAMSGKRGLELGPGSELALLNYLLSLGADVAGIDSEVNAEQASNPRIIKVNKYREYLNSLPEEEVFDFVYARRSLYFSSPSEKLEGKERLDRIRERYLPIVARIKTSGLLVMSVYQGDEESDLLSRREARMLGLEIVSRYKTRAGFTQVITSLRKVGPPQDEYPALKSPAEPSLDAANTETTALLGTGPEPVEGPIAPGISKLILNGKEMSVEQAREEVSGLISEGIIFNALLTGATLEIGISPIVVNNKQIHHEDIHCPDLAEGVLRCYITTKPEITIIPNMEPREYSPQEKMGITDDMIKLCRSLVRLGVPHNISLDYNTRYIFINMRVVALGVSSRYADEDVKIKTVSNLANRPLSNVVQERINVATPPAAAESPATEPKAKGPTPPAAETKPPRASSSGANEKPAAEPAAPAAAVEGGKIEPSPLSSYENKTAEDFVIREPNHGGIVKAVKERRDKGEWPIPLDGVWIYNYDAHSDVDLGGGLDGIWVPAMKRLKIAKDVCTPIFPPVDTFEFQKKQIKIATEFTQAYGHPIVLSFCGDFFSYYRGKWHADKKDISRWVDWAFSHFENNGIEICGIYFAESKNYLNKEKIVKSAEWGNADDSADTKINNYLNYIDEMLKVRMTRHIERIRNSAASKRSIADKLGTDTNIATPAASQPPAAEPTATAAELPKNSTAGLVLPETAIDAIGYFITHPFWNWQNRSKLVKKFLVGWYAAVAERNEICNMFGLVQFIKQHKNIRWHHWATRSIGIGAVWIAMTYSLILTMHILASNLGIPPELGLILAYALRIHRIANILAHGIYNTILPLIGFAPLVANNEPYGKSEHPTMPVTKDNAHLPVNGAIPQGGILQSRPPAAEPSLDAANTETTALLGTGPEQAKCVEGPTAPAAAVEGGKIEPSPLVAAAAPRTDENERASSTGASEEPAPQIEKIEASPLFLGKLTPQDVNRLELEIERLFPERWYGWNGEPRKIALEEVLFSATYGLGPHVSMEDRVSYVKNIAHRLIAPNLIPWIRGIVWQLVGLSIVLTKSIVSEPTEHEKNSHHSRFLLSLTVYPFAFTISFIVNIYLFIIASGAVPNAKRAFNDDTWEFPIFARNYDSGAIYRFILIHELSHTRNIGSGCSAFGFLRFINPAVDLKTTGDKVIKLSLLKTVQWFSISIFSAYLMYSFRGYLTGFLPFSALWIFSLMKATSASVGFGVAGFNKFFSMEGRKYVDETIAAFRQTEPSMQNEENWYCMGELDKEPSWTYKEAAIDAAIYAYVSAEKIGAPEAAYDILRLNLTERLSKIDIETFGLESDKPLPLNEAASIVAAYYTEKGAILPVDTPQTPVTKVTVTPNEPIPDDLNRRKFLGLILAAVGINALAGQTQAQERGLNIDVSGKIDDRTNGRYPDIVNAAVSILKTIALRIPLRYHNIKNKGVVFDIRIDGSLSAKVKVMPEALPGSRSREIVFSASDLADTKIKSAKIEELQDAICGMSHTAFEDVGLGWIKWLVYAPVIFAIAAVAIATFFTVRLRHVAFWSNKYRRDAEISDHEYQKDAAQKSGGRGYEKWRKKQRRGVLAMSFGEPSDKGEQKRDDPEILPVDSKNVKFLAYDNLSDVQKADPRLQVFIKEYYLKFYHIEERLKKDIDGLKERWTARNPSVAIIGFYYGEPVSIYTYIVSDNCFSSGNVWVKEPYQKAGIGYLMMKAALADMQKNRRSQEYYEIFSADNNAAQGLHRKFATEYPEAVEIPYGDINDIRKMFVYFDRYEGKKEASDAAATEPTAPAAPDGMKEELITEKLRDVKKEDWYSRTAKLSLGNGQVIGVKFLKNEDENESVLEHEARTMQELRDAGEEVPVPLKTKDGSYVFSYEGALINAPPEVDPSHKFITYLTTEDYFVYPKDIKDKERMTLCAKRSIVQFARMLKSGYIHTSLSTLTHNGWIPWFWNYRGTAGMIQRLDENLAYVNIRLQGLADFAHIRKVRRGDYLYYQIGSALGEWAVAVTYHSLENGISREDAVAIIKSGLEEYLNTLGVNAQYNGKDLEGLAKFVNSFKGKSLDPTDLAALIRKTLEKTELSPVYTDLSKQSTKVERLSDACGYASTVLVKHGSTLYSTWLGDIVAFDSKAGHKETILKGCARGSSDDHSGIIIDEDGAFYIIDSIHDCIGTVDAKTGTEKTIVKGKRVWGILKEGDFIYSYADDSIVRFNMKTHTWEDVIKVPPGHATAWTKAGDLFYIANWSNRCVYEINAKTGAIRVIAKNNVLYAAALIVENGILYALDSNAGKECIDMVDIQSDRCEEIARGALSSPQAMVKDGNVFYVTNNCSSDIVKISMPPAQLKLPPAPRNSVTRPDDNRRYHTPPNDGDVIPTPEDAPANLNRQVTSRPKPAAADEAAQKKPATAEITESEVKDVLNDVNKKMQETVFEQEYITKVARKISNMGLVRGRRVENLTIETVLLETWRRISEVGTPDEIRAMDVYEFANRLGCRQVAENKLKMSSSPIYYDPMSCEIYYCPSHIERWSREKSGRPVLGKSAFVHELFEKTIHEAEFLEEFYTGKTSGKFRDKDYFSITDHLSSKIRMQEAIFAALMDDEKEINAVSYGSNADLVNLCAAYISAMREHSDDRASRLRSLSDEVRTLMHELESHRGDLKEEAKRIWSEASRIASPGRSRKIYDADGIPFMALRDTPAQSRPAEYFRKGDQLVVNARGQMGFVTSVLTKGVVAEVDQEKNKIEIEPVTPDGVLTELRGSFDITDKDVWKWDAEKAPFVPAGKRVRKPVYIPKLGLPDDIEHKLMYGYKILTVEELESVPEIELVEAFGKDNSALIKNVLEAWHRKNEELPAAKPPAPAAAVEGGKIEPSPLSSRASSSGASEETTTATEGESETYSETAPGTRPLHIEKEILDRFLPLVRGVSKYMAKRLHGNSEDTLYYMAAAYGGLVETLAKYGPDHPDVKALAAKRMMQRILDQFRSETFARRRVMGKMRIVDSRKDILNETPDRVLSEAIGKKDRMENGMDQPLAQPNISRVYAIQEFPSGGELSHTEIEDLLLSRGRSPKNHKELIESDEMRKELAEILEAYPERFTANEMDVIRKIHINKEYPDQTSLAKASGTPLSTVNLRYHSAIRKIQQILSSSRRPKDQRISTSGTVTTSETLRAAGKEMPVQALATAGAPVAEPFTNAEQMSPTGSHIEAIITPIHDLIKNNISLHPIPANSKILLSETLFDEMDLGHLKGLLGENSLVAIASPKDIRRASINRKASKENLVCVIKAEDYDNKELWNKNHKDQNKATLIVLNEDLRGSRYLYLEGVVGLARALMSNDADRARMYLSILFSKTDIGKEVDDALLLKYLVDDPRRFADLIRFKPIVPFESDELLKDYKMKVENFLIAA